MAIYAGVRGYLDKLPVNKVTEFEERLLSEVRANGEDLLETLRTEREITDATEAKLKEFVDKFSASFA